MKSGKSRNLKKPEETRNARVVEETTNCEPRREEIYLRSENRRENETVTPVNGNSVGKQVNKKTKTSMGGRAIAKNNSNKKKVDRFEKKEEEYRDHVLFIPQSYKRNRRLRPLPLESLPQTKEDRTNEKKGNGESERAEGNSRSRGSRGNNGGGRGGNRGGGEGEAEGGRGGNRGGEGEGERRGNRGGREGGRGRNTLVTTQQNLNDYDQSREENFQSSSATVLQRFNMHLRSRASGVSSTLRRSARHQQNTRNTNIQ